MAVFRCPDAARAKKHPHHVRHAALIARRIDSPRHDHQIGLIRGVRYGFVIFMADSPLDSTPRDERMEVFRISGAKRKQVRNDQTRKSPPLRESDAFPYRRIIEALIGSARIKHDPVDFSARS
jgi:hypothetical protein